MISRSARIAAGLGVGLAAVVAVPAIAVLGPSEVNTPDPTALAAAAYPVGTPGCALSKVDNNLRVVVDEELPQGYLYSVSFQWQQNQSWTQFDSGTTTSALVSSNAPANKTYQAVVTYPDGTTTVYCTLEP